MINKSTLKDRKRSIMSSASKRWSEEKAVAADKAVPLVKSDLKLERISNYEIREKTRNRLAPSKFTKTRFFEKKVGSTLDFNKFPPNDIAYKAGIPVARLYQIVEGRMPEGFGTGFLISSNLLITNHHVFETSMDAWNCGANFLYEYDEQGLKSGIYFELNPEKFFLNYQPLDFCLVYVESTALDGKSLLKDLSYIPLIETSGKVIKGDAINIIQYPDGGPKQYAYTENEVKAILDDVGFIQYTTDTQGASSGSPAFNKFYEAAALHHCGIPYEVNGKIYTTNGTVWDGEDENDVQWIANEGVSISRIVSYLKSCKINDPAQAKILDALLKNTKDPLMGNTGKAIEEKLPVKTNINESLIINKTLKQNSMDGINFNFYGNTTINLTITPAEAVKGLVNAEIKAGGVEALEKSIRFDEDYDNRENKGYKEDFIDGFEIKVPDVEAGRRNEIFLEDGEPCLLKYYHYSLIMNKKRRMLMWSAVNVDYTPDKRSDKSRKELGTDKWRPDPRIPAAVQILQKELYDPARTIDLGHIVRREDNCWGNTDKEIEYANADTFHMTNCTPQHEAFNRANPPEDGIHGVWGKLEEHIQKQLKPKVQKATIFAGPVLDNENDPTEDFGFGKIQYPMKFWKVVVVLDEDNKLHSYGFLLDQTNVVKKFGLGLERLDFKLFKKQQISIREITKLTDVKFDKQVYDSDILKNNFDESSSSAKSYENVDEIIVKPLDVDSSVITSKLN
jgi:endonuclease G